MNTAKLHAWLCLKTAPELGSKGTLELLKRYPDPLAFVSHPAHELFASGILKAATVQHLLQGTLPKDIERIHKLMQQHTISFVCLGDEAYPAALKGIANPPLILYYRGSIALCGSKLCLAVVGTRKPNTYGIEMCRKLIKPVCEKGAVIVSGLATGIDTVAHLAALEAGTITIAVLAAGLESIYPLGNKQLAERIATNGALLSEYEPGSKLERWNFADRNRIISAISKAVFIVEGPIDSGAMLTASYAIQQGRPVLALPGNINNHNAQGPNRLIQNGAALIACPEDILRLLGLDAVPGEQLELIPRLEPEEQTLYDLFATEQHELSFDELLLKTGLSFGKLSILLLNLELKGVIAKSSGNSFIML